MPRRSGCTVKRRRRIYIRRRRHNANSVIQLTRWKARLTVRRRGFEGLRIDSGIWWQIDRRDANLSNCTLGTRGCITSDLAVARVRTISAFQSVCSPMLLCPSGDKSICDPFTIPHCFLPHLRSTFGYEQRSLSSRLRQCFQLRWAPFLRSPDSPFRYPLYPIVYPGWLNFREELRLTCDSMHSLQVSVLST